MDIKEIFKLKEPTITDKATLKERAGHAMNFYRNNFEKELQILIFKQLDVITGNATTESEMQFIRGTLNGFYLVIDWFNNQKGILNDKEE